ncbi:hypothetical protein HDU81_001238 [Chytriomyces hyalinus]|nr:hypothetical protein HDU81_001238 [Chytriomyces hyalinus]
MRGETEKKDHRDTHQFKKGLHFEAETPNFLKMLQGNGTKLKQIPNFDEDAEEDADANYDDEAPQVVLGKNVSEGDAVKALGLKDSASLQVTELGGKLKKGKKRSVQDVDSEAATSKESVQPSSKIAEIGSTGGSAIDKRRKRMEDLKKKSDGAISAGTGSINSRTGKAGKSGAAAKKMLSFDFDE